MILTKFSYSEFEDTPRYWDLNEFDLAPVNLIVGNNSSGKSRTLNVIYGLSRLILDSKINFNSGNYHANFLNNEGSEIKYNVQFENAKVVKEELEKSGEIMFTRDKSGEGEIYNTELKRKHKFKIPKDQLQVTRRDEFQYPYLEELYNWASNVRHFRFSKEEEKQTLVLIDSNKPKSESQKQNVTNQAIEIFRKGKIEYKEKYVQKVIEDFNSIGYDISDIEWGTLHSIKVDSPIGNKVVGLRVKENDREAFTDQHEMSDGMFRALSLIIHYNYYELTNKNLIVLVDDIGEGLDFERSTNLIRLLINKSTKFDIQLIMSSNDKFVMNNTKLEYWQIIDRKGGKVKMYNHNNSSDLFKRFKFTGLNNFDFFASGSYHSE
jgi:predicted ATPase